MDRITRLRQLLPGENLLLDTAIARQYLTGFESSDGLLLITPERAVLAMDSRYFEAASLAVTDAEVVPYDARFYALVCEQKRVLTEYQLTFSRFGELSRALTDCKLEPSALLSNTLIALRSVKDEEELRRLRASQALTDAAFAHVCDILRPGLTERQVALELEFFMRKNGAQSAAFETIVLTGAHGSMPHGVPDDREICNGDLVTMDFGARLDGYCSDMTRTVSVGTPDPFAAELYDIVLSAQTAALGVIRAGVAKKEADAAARNLITAAGYGEYFGHATGHGVGLEIHEAPNLSPRAEGFLAPGNVVTVEPGIYVPGKAGVRIEDFVFVTPSGCENLTKSPKERRKS